MPQVVRDALDAARLDTAFFNRIEGDRSYTLRALLIVLVVSAASGIGSGIWVDGVTVAEGIVTSTATGAVGWLLWSALALLIGTRLFGGTTDYGEMLRVIGFAFVPRAIGVIPALGPVGWVWSIVVAVVAIREGQEFSTARAVGTVLVGGVTAALLTWTVTLLYGLVF